MVKKERGDKSGRGTLRREILKILKKAPSKRLAISELKKKLGVKRNAYHNGRFYPSHFYKTIKKLENSRKIRIISERVPERIESRIVLVLEEEKYAGPSEFEIIFKHLLDTDSTIRRQAAEDFQTVCQRKRVAISSAFLKTVEMTLTNKNYADTWPYILRGLWSILVGAKSKKDTQTIAEIKTLENVLIKMASSSLNERVACGLAIDLLGQLETRVAVDTIFEILVESDAKTYEELKSYLAQTLVHLFPIFEQEIREKLYKLLKSESTRGKAEFIFGELRQRIRW